MTKDMNEIHQFWREYNYAHPPEQKKEIVNANPIESDGVSFPIREDYNGMLEEAGYLTNEEVLEAGEEVILAIDGIGPSTVKTIFGGE